MFPSILFGWISNVCFCGQRDSATKAQSLPKTPSARSTSQQLRTSTAKVPIKKKKKKKQIRTFVNFSRQVSTAFPRHFLSLPLFRIFSPCRNFRQIDSLSLQFQNQCNGHLETFTGKFHLIEQAKISKEKKNQSNMKKAKLKSSSKARRWGQRKTTSLLSA